MSRSSHRTRSCSQKEIRRELQSIPQTKQYTFLLAKGPPASPHHGWWESHVSTDPTPADRNFGCFYFLAPMNNTAIYQFLCGPMFSFLLTTYLGVELLGHVVTLCLNIWETLQLFSKVVAPYTLEYRVPGSSHPHQQLLMSGFLILAILVGVSGVSLCLWLLNISWV